ncbi:hypothetical protein M899_1842 [Bacteriovorax sp. BSW11_IV]|uniref:hypothetical protein n=1 Tax=Bacteriovorax sp. BSW11_IV TaxID=1353529 RepID=UPI00038A05F4|nr:hypothetical protein [Bacteriovorax sp. BSW11_IV]EQC48519.1 hypothetical protein M899_1842 [Bacteriovorax sp. BSW11_IV]
MSINKYFILLCMAIFNITTFAGNEVGNGGGVLVNKTTSRAEFFFDVYETQDHYGFDIQWPDQDRYKNDVQMAKAFVSRLREYDKKLERQLKNFADDFYKESSFISNSHLFIFDTGMGIEIPSNYELKQLIIQYTFDNGQTKYVIDQKYWSELSASQRAVAILHEVVYRRALIVNPRLFSSVKVRQFVAFLISDEITLFSKESYKKMLRALELN